MKEYSSLKLNHFLSEFLLPWLREREAGSVAQMVLEYVFGLSRMEVIMDRKVILDPTNLEKLNMVLMRLARQEPIQYITGRAYFYNRYFKVNPKVLIPRPETEELVYLVIGESQIPGPRILDIGTGSGCIAVTLALNIPGCKITAWDIDREILEVASLNALESGVKIKWENVNIFTWEPDLAGTPQFDIIISNPPYVRRSEASNMNRNVYDYEPHQAIFVEDDAPLIYYRRIVEISKFILSGNGRIYFEINEIFGREVATLLLESGFKNTRILKDIHGKDRIVTGGTE